MPKAWFYYRPVDTRRKAFGQAMLFGLWAFVTVTALVLRPATEGHGTHQLLGFPPCPSVIFFNRPCPGCGLTTSFTRLLHGDVFGAFQAHWLGPILYGLFTWVAIAGFVAFIKKLRIDIHTPRFQVVLFVFCGFLFAYGFGRFMLVTNYQTDREKALAAFVSQHHK